MSEAEQVLITSYTYACQMVEQLNPGANIAHAYPYPQLPNVLAVLHAIQTQKGSRNV